MEEAAGTLYHDRLSRQDSERALLLIRSWMARLGIRSVYELFLMLSVPRATLNRWFVGNVRLPVGGMRAIAEALAVRAGVEDPKRDLEAIISDPPARTCLRLLADELRVRRLPYRRTLEALHAAKLMVVSTESDSDEVAGKGSNEN